MKIYDIALRCKEQPIQILTKNVCLQCGDLVELVANNWLEVQAGSYLIGVNTNVLNNPPVIRLMVYRRKTDRGHILTVSSDNSRDAHEDLYTTSGE